MNLHRGLMLSVALALVAAGPAFSQTPASNPQAKAMADCLIANSTPAHENAMRAMLIDALKEDTDALNKSAMTLSMAVMATATQFCNLKMTDLQKPEFAEGMGLYGEYMGEKIMAAALAKLGM